MTLPDENGTKLSRRAVLVASAALIGQATIARAAPRSGTPQAGGILRIGWAEFKPYEFRDVISGDLKGILIDLARDLAARMGDTHSFVLDTWPTLPTGVAGSRFDVAFMGYSAERAKLVDYSHPLYTTVFSALVRAGDGPKTWEQLNQPGKSIAVVTGSSADEAFAQLEQQGKIKASIQRVRDVGSGLLAVQSGNSTAYANQLDALSAMTSAQPGLALIDGSFGTTWFGVVVAKNNAPMLETVNKAVASMAGDGTIKRLIAAYDIKGAEATR